MVEHYSALTRKEIRTHVTWMNQEVILNEINQTQKGKYRDSSHMGYLEKSDSYRQKVKWWLPGVGAAVGAGVRHCLKDTVSFWKDETVLVRDGGDDCKQCECT